MTPETSMCLMLKLNRLLQCFQSWGTQVDRHSLTALSIFLCSGDSLWNLRQSLNGEHSFPPFSVFFFLDYVLKSGRALTWFVCVPSTGLSVCRLIPAQFSGGWKNALPKHWMKSLWEQPSSHCLHPVARPMLGGNTGPQGDKDK